LHLSQLAGLLNASQGGDDGIEEKEEDEGAILVEMQLSISRLVALAADIVESLEQRHELVEVFQAGDVFVADFFTFFSSHAGDYARRGGTRNTTLGLFEKIGDVTRNNRAEQDWFDPLFTVKGLGFQMIGGAKQRRVETGTECFVPEVQAALVQLLEADRCACDAQGDP
jgi:hypothetical protein